jgi:acyl dehydratase
MRYFEDFTVGETIETAPYTLDEAEIIAYAREYDPQPFHLDAAAAKKTIFGGIIASGWHTAALMMRLQVDGFLKDWAALGSPGFDDLRWLKPVRPGDSIRVRATCVEKTPSRSRPGTGSLRLATAVVNQDGEVVMTITQIGRCRLRSASNG